MTIREGSPDSLGRERAQVRAEAPKASATIFGSTSHHAAACTYHPKHFTFDSVWPRIRAHRRFSTFFQEQAEGSAGRRQPPSGQAPDAPSAADQTKAAAPLRHEQLGGPLDGPHSIGTDGHAHELQERVELVALNCAATSSRVTLSRPCSKSIVVTPP
jgi:hypothetical protein